MGRLPGDPGLGRQVLFAFGARLPDRNREWVRHELTDAGWRGRLLSAGWACNKGNAQQRANEHAYRKRHGIYS